MCWAELMQAEGFAIEKASPMSTRRVVQRALPLLLRGHPLLVHVAYSGCGPLALRAACGRAGFVRWQFTCVTVSRYCECC
jgi:hypothetical protein